MRAAVLRAFGQPLALEEIAEPSLAEDEVLIRVEACGVCHSDLHVAEGDWPQFASIVKLPLVLGHEIAGRVVKTGSRVSDVEIGARVGLPWIYWTCGECAACREGNENLCSRQSITGVTVDGGYAEFVKAKASHVVPIPEPLSAVEAAPLFCAGVTVYRALEKASVAHGQKLAIFGIGGLGHLAVQIAREMGAEVIAVDVHEEKIELAKKLGAAEGLVAQEAGKRLRKAGGVHVALVTSAAKAAYDVAFQALRPGGILLVVGLPAENICFPTIMMAAREVRVRATAVGTRQDVREVLAMAAAGKIRCLLSTTKLEGVNDALSQLRQGSVTGRIVLNWN
ncbi:MAG TPA: zinc-dependent alcohol dehydrogenase [Terriglobales bacterium]|nr:zinc-dependent alcohol dehydrogenase [Terriglobales bacterium]